MEKLTVPEWLKLNKHYQRIFYALTALFGIYVLPIILADRYYQDDLSRSLRGITGWTNDARPLTEWIMKWLCGGSPIGDIAPLPLLLSVVILAYALTLYFRQNMPDTSSVWMLLSIGFLVISNPYFLSNLSYRYDCFTMVLALCAAILSYAIPDKLIPWKVFGLSFIMCIIILTTYQPCIGMYIALGCLELFFMLLISEIDWMRLIMRFLALVAGVLIYYFVIMKHYVTGGSWQQSAYQLSLGDDTGLFSAVSQNLNSLLKLLGKYVDSVPFPIILLFLTLTAIGMIAACLTIVRSGGKLKIWVILYTLLLPLFIPAGSLLPLLVLTPTKFSVSTHTLIALCSCGLWVGIMIRFIADKAKTLTILLLIPCLVFNMTFVYTYGNASKSQKQYEEYMTYNIVRDIDTINADGQYHSLTIKGKTPQSRETAMLCDKYPLLKMLIPVYITNSSYLGGAQLQHYLQYDMEFCSLSEDEMNTIETIEPLLSNNVYSCYTHEDKIIIQFHATEP